jgi:hypothetical protein
VSVGCVGVEVVFIGQVEVPLFVGSEGADGLGVAVAFGLAEGKLAEVARGGVVGSGIGVITEEVEGDACELEMASSSQKPNVIIIGDGENVSNMAASCVHDSLKLLRIGVDVEVGVVWLWAAIPVNILSLIAYFKKGGM